MGFLTVLTQPLSQPPSADHPNHGFSQVLSSLSSPSTISVLFQEHLEGPLSLTISDTEEIGKELFPLW